MITYETGSLALSLAGHDKDDLFIILAENGEYVYLADGETRGVNKPKRKNKKHIQTIHRVSESINKKLTDGEPVRDEEIKYFIRCYKKENQEK